MGCIALIAHAPQAMTPRLRPSADTGATPHGQWLMVKLSFKRRRRSGDSCAMGHHRVVVMTRPKREGGQPETVWLDDDQQRAWRQLLSMIMELPAALERDLQRTTGLTTFEYLVLANLSEADDRTLRMSELAAKANSSLSRLSHVVRRLEDDGLVLRGVCADDGRVSVVELTKAGMRRVAAAAPLHVAKVRELVVEPLTKADLIGLGKAAEAITDRIAESG
ncbi:MarR family transcriptional regulator [Mycobacterium sp. 852013-50091_SCH5140682]|uniref:MarR family winged helix-turn-helix transcriptional regulator n=1 Tax=Mycobacterium sp. 852013-50091_SCH5140682 TaxID=1834109 RepID=UPI001E51FE60|nr:MarR family transcriptional regulator [Mycobacterium sp. 852013-50091_SCH5140682]